LAVGLCPGPLKELKCSPKLPSRGGGGLGMKEDRAKGVGVEGGKEGPEGKGKITHGNWANMIVSINKCMQQDSLIDLGNGKPKKVIRRCQSETA